MKSKEKLDETEVAKLLRVELEKLQSQLETIHIEPSLASGDSADLSAHLSDEHISFALRDRLLAEIAAVKNALARVGKPGFGECEACGDEIEIKRIIHVPTARLCVDCQHKVERNR